MNVALNKSAYQQNPFYENDNTGDASNAVDGKRSDLTRNGGQCVISGARGTATWWVNLTSTHNIQNISIYFMTDNTSWGIVFFFSKTTGLMLLFFMFITYNVSSYTSSIYSVFLKRKK